MDVSSHERPGIATSLVSLVRATSGRACGPMEEKPDEPTPRPDAMLSSGRKDGMAHLGGPWAAAVRVGVFFHPTKGGWLALARGLHCV